MIRLLLKYLFPFAGAWMLMSSCSSTAVNSRLPSAITGKSECVILIHGLGRTYRSMRKIEDSLLGAGYITVNLDYPSRKKTIESIASEYVPLATGKCRNSNAESIHFVTHSMGGIVARKAIKDSKPDILGRVVMLSPPNQGSLVAEALKERWYYQLLNGPSGLQLTTSPDSLPNRLGPVDYPVGVIAGDKPAFFDEWLLDIFTGDSDGKVSVERTKIEGMSDFLIVHKSHTYIILNVG
jgi:pimeloyl-ACP methyl ester carboxylesterase